jgi:outer membrane receptor protein involved in Fe transport
MKKFELLAASAIAVLSTTPAFAQEAATAPAAPPPVETAQATPMSEDIVVTAQRQSERLQDVPIAVSAFSANALEKQQIVNPAALQQSLPNVTFTKTNFTGSSFTIRGIGDLCTGTTCDTATGIAVNDMPLVSTRLFESEFFDMERIEVLRGPQGTLFGRNATSGVINFITAKPDLSGIHANGEFEYGNYNTKEAKGMLNIPLGHTLGIRVAGVYLKRDGFTQNLYDDSQIDGRDLYSVRGTLSWEPDPNTRLDLIGYYFHEKDNRDRIQKQLCHRDPTGILGCLPDKLAYQTTNGNSTLSTILSSNEFINIATSGAAIRGTGGIPFGALGLGSVYGTDAFSNAVNPTDNRTVDLDYNPTYYAEEQQYQAKFFHDFGQISLNLTGGYAENKVDSRTDYTDAVENPLTNNPGLGLLAGLAAAGGGAANPFVGLAGVVIPNGPNGGVCQSDLGDNAGGIYSGASVGCYPQSLDFDRSRAYTTQWSIEGHIDSHFSGMFNFLLGAIYLDQKTTDNDYYVGSFGLDYASGVLGLANAASNGLPGNYYLSTPYYDNDEVNYGLKSYGIFGETYFQFNDKLKLTIGLRYNHDQKNLQARTTTLDALEPYGDTDYNGPGAVDWTYSNAAFSRLTGRAVLDYKITNNNLLYFSYSRGYKSGGINPPVPAQFAVKEVFSPEQVDAFELGSKNEFLNGELTLNLTGFYYKYKNLQLARIVDRTAVNDNISADIYGIEAEAIVRPIPQFAVNMNFSYLHSKVSTDEFLPNPRDPSGGDTSAVIIKDITNASNCAVASNVGSEAAAIGYVDAVNAAINGSVPGNAYPLAPAQQVLSNGTYGAYSVCAQLEANTALAAGLGGVTYYGSGVPVNVKGNQLPQAPTYKFAVGAQYTINVGHDSALIPRVDLNYTGNSYASIFNQQIDRMPGYAVINAQLEFDGPGDRFYVRGFVKNLTNNSAITGQYVTDQSSGLFTNVFTIEPRQYGLAVGFKF